MSLLRKKAWWRKLFHSRISLLIIFCLLILLSIAVFDRWVVAREVADRRLEKEEEFQIAEQRKEILEEKVNNINDEEGVESEIRKHFDVAREGEQVVVLVENKENIEPITPTASTEPKRHWWSPIVSWWPL